MFANILCILLGATAATIILALISINREETAYENNEEFRQYQEDRSRNREL